MVSGSSGQDLSYLEKYNYFHGPMPLNLKEPADMEEAIEEMQDFLGLPVTGELDAETMAKIRGPRCGVADFIGPRKNSKLVRRRKRYALSGQKWSKKSLKYSIKNYTPDLPKSDVSRIMKNALQVWADKTPLTFTETSRGSSDIDILFARNEHGDGYDFDGEGGTLAHAYFPGAGIGGDAHFDDDEYFTHNSYRGTNLLIVAAHELGHSLGLAHSSDENALMAPYYQGYQQGFRLSYDDVRGIQELYGRAPQNKPKPPSRPNTPNRPPQRPEQPQWPEQRPGQPGQPDWPQWPPRRPEQPPHRPGNPELPPHRPGNPELPPHRPGNPGQPPQGPDLCAATFQAAMHFDGMVYLFQGSQYWMMEENGVIPPGYPKLITSNWINAPTNIDAAITLPSTENVAFFKGNKWYEYRGSFLFRQGDLASLGLPMNVRRLDAALIWEANNMPYFFTGRDYYRYNERLGRVDRGYPKPITPNWVGIPGNVNAAFGYQGFTYIIKGQSYYKFDNNAVRAVAGPRDFGADVLNCRVRRGLLRAMNLKAGSGVDKYTAQLTTVLFSLIFTLGYLLLL
ncbi:stromelysin-1-like [Amphiura filiformis]|uniref:stromelysin-1-like n=1 Tax=Amphiura filiformis TaxID=82378 RepID=UPI003B225DD8